MLESEPSLPPIDEVEPMPMPTVPLAPINWCEMAWAGFNAAWLRWNQTLGQNEISYKTGARALTRKADIDGWHALNRAIALLYVMCQGRVPPWVQAMSGIPIATRPIIVDM